MEKEPAKASVPAPAPPADTAKMALSDSAIRIISPPVEVTVEPLIPAVLLIDR